MKKNIIIALILILALYAIWDVSKKDSIKDKTSQQQVIKPKEEVIKKNQLMVQNERKLDFGFKFKIEDCLINQTKELIIVDVDNDDTYVLASAKQYYSGPYPIAEEQLIKEKAKDFDKKSGITKIECSKLESKYPVLSE